MELFDVKEYTNIDGNVTYQVPVGYCTCSLHEGYLTKNEAKNHGCVGKHCKYLIKNEEHEFWFMKENEKVVKKYFDIVKRKYYRNEISTDEYTRLKEINDLMYMEDYIYRYKLEPKDEYMTVSNYVAKTIVHPKKPNIIARIKKEKKIKYNKWRNEMMVG